MNMRSGCIATIQTDLQSYQPILQFVCILKILEREFEGKLPIESFLSLLVLIQRSFTKKHFLGKYATFYPPSGPAGSWAAGCGYHYPPVRLE